jgi:hypothetical protein
VKGEERHSAVKWIQALIDAVRHIKLQSLLKNWTTTVVHHDPP